MFKSYHCENVWKENDRGTDNNPKPDFDNINQQLTILNRSHESPKYRNTREKYRYTCERRLLKTPILALINQLSNIMST